MSTPRPRRWRRVLATLLAAGIVLALALGARSWHETSHIRLARLELATGKLDAPLRVLQVSDVHEAGDGVQQQVVDIARETRPDLIAITGDVLNYESHDFSELESLLTRLDELDLPVFFVQGNHDFGDHLTGILERLRAHRVTVLDNSHHRMDGPWGRLDIIGTADYYDQLGDLPAAMKGTRADAYRLVLTHDPGIVDDLATSGADLAICGHTHGGQVRLPWVGAVTAPGQGWFPHYDRGLFEVGNSRLYIDQGVGQTVPLRLLAPAQVTLITLTPTR